MLTLVDSGSSATFIDIAMVA
jgi:hypothetical protein